MMGGNQRSEPSPSMMGPPPPAMQTKASHPGRAGGMSSPTPGNSRPDIDMARAEPPAQRSQRSEMKGPTDISSILEGLKKREPPPSSNNNSNSTKRVNISASQEDGSTISAQDANELAGARAPKSRRKKSERNTISLDI